MHIHTYLYIYIIHMKHREMKIHLGLHRLFPTVSTWHSVCYPHISVRFKPTFRHKVLLWELSFIIFTFLKLFLVSSAQHIQNLYTGLIHHVGFSVCMLLYSYVSGIGYSCLIQYCFRVSQQGHCLLLLKNTTHKSVCFFFVLLLHAWRSLVTFPLNQNHF